MSLLTEAERPISVTEAAPLITPPAAPEKPREKITNPITTLNPVRDHLEPIIQALVDETVNSDLPKRGETAEKPREVVLFNLAERKIATVQRNKDGLVTSLGGIFDAIPLFLDDDGTYKIRPTTRSTLSGILAAPQQEAPTKKGQEVHHGLRPSRRPSGEVLRPPTNSTAVKKG